MKPNDFVGMLFLARNIAHSVHLNTRSYAKHKALDFFYKEIVNLADSLSEYYQGKYLLLGPIPIIGASKTTKIVEFLEDQVSTIEKERNVVFDEKDTPLQNIIDEICSLYYSTLYKLKYLT